MRLTQAAVFLLALVAAASAAEDYWWKYPSSDCNKVDVQPQPACAGNGSVWGDVAALERCCAATPTGPCPCM